MHHCTNPTPHRLFNVHEARLSIYFNIVLPVLFHSDLKTKAANQIIIADNLFPTLVLNQIVWSNPSWNIILSFHKTCLVFIFVDSGSFLVLLKFCRLYLIVFHPTKSWL